MCYIMTAKAAYEPPPKQGVQPRLYAVNVTVICKPAHDKPLSHRGPVFIYIKALSSVIKEDNRDTPLTP